MTNNITIRLAGKEITTTQAKLDAAQFDCCLHGGTAKSLVPHRLTLDKWRNVRCASCGQHPHETARNVLAAQLQ